MTYLSVNYANNNQKYITKITNKLFPLVVWLIDIGMSKRIRIRLPDQKRRLHRSRKEIWSLIIC